MSPVEGNLQFDFSAAVSWERFYEQGLPMPRGMSFVDFVVEETDSILLIEVKDPSDPGATAAAQAKFIHSLTGEELIDEKLVPKARDSYTFLHLMERDKKPFLYVVLLGLDAFPDEAALLVGFKDRLLKRIRQEAASPWKRKYVQDCIVVTLKTWTSSFADYAVSRVVP